METLSIAQRLQILEDKEAIKDITYQYALFTNQGWNGFLTRSPSTQSDKLQLPAIFG